LGARFFVAAAVTAAVLPASALAGARSHLASDALSGHSAVTAANDSAVSKQLWSSTTLDQIADDIVGTTDMSVLVEDDATEWATFFPTTVDSTNVLGVVFLSYAPLYHKILVAPSLYPVFGAWFTNGSAVGDEYPFSVAAMTLIHESFHWKLLSGDESTVNACALKYLPFYLERDFQVPPTVTTTTTQLTPVTTTTKVPLKHTKVVKYRVKVHGKWVTKTKKVTTTTYVSKTETTYTSQPVTSTTPNPLFQTIVADAADFYAHQPPPYNAGTCSV
jgi:hypothetical protein